MGYIDVRSGSSLLDMKSAYESQRTLDNRRDSIKMTISRGSNSVVECDLAKVEVAGSNPVSRSIRSCSPLAPRPARVYAVRGRQEFYPLRRGTQVVRERSAKPLCVGSIPTRASNISVASLQTAIQLSPLRPYVLLKHAARRPLGPSRFRMAFTRTVIDPLPPKRFAVWFFEL